MGGLFGGGGSSGSAVAAPQPLPTPKVTRMPTETDPSILAAAQRTRSAAMRRTGRLSTILTDNTGSMIGSSGKTLGA
jgi:hypothetical protein